MSKCERTRLLGEAWNPAQGLKWVWGPCQAPSLWCGALLSRGASWEGEFHHWKTLASEVTGNLKLNWRGRECYWTWKSNAKHEVCVFQVVWLWYLTGVSSQLADLFPLLNRLSRDIECGTEHMTRSLLQRNKGQECLGAREALSGKVDTGRHVYAGFILLSKVPETLPEGHLTVQVTDRPIWINSLRERTMACLCSVSESPKFLPETEIKLRFHSVGQRSCNRVNLWKLKTLRIADFYPEEMILSWWTSIKPCLLVLPPFHTVLNLEGLSSSLKLMCYQGHWRWVPKMTEERVCPQRLSSLSISN